MATNNTAASSEVRKKCARGGGVIPVKLKYAQPALLAAARITTKSAVATLTNPDGTYTINGLPTNNQYLIYVHPLPPDALPQGGEGLLPPEDQNGAVV